jgi:GT2 family glycosyltransferase
VYQPACNSNAKNRLQDVRERIQRGQAGSDDLLTLISCVEEIVAGLKQQREEAARSQRGLRNQQLILNTHVAAIENSLIFRFLRWLGGPLLEWKVRFEQLGRAAGFRGLRPSEVDREYERWLSRREAKMPPAAWYQQRAEGFKVRPVFSILMAVINPERACLEQAVRSILDQTYERWELCLCDSSSNEKWVHEYLAGLAQTDSRIRVVCPEDALGAAALNRACASGTGEYCVFLGQQDSLSPLALFHLAELLQNQAADLLYTDEDSVPAQGGLAQPVFKPDWSPDLLLSAMYLGRSLTVSREALRVAGGLRPEFDGAELYDLALRLTERTDSVGHIPLVLYHSRGQTERSAPAQNAARRALEDAVRRRKLDAAVEDGPVTGSFRLRRHVRNQSLVSIIICSRTADLLDRCLRSLDQRTDYRRPQVVVVQHLDGSDGAAMKVVLSRYDVKCIPYEGAFHFSRMCNAGAKAAEGEVFVFLNDDVEPLVPSWLSDLVAQAGRPEVGVVGGKLLYPSGSLQHGGIAIGIGDGCAHPGRGSYGSRYWPWLDLTRNVSAVTGACFAIHRQVFCELRGFDEQFPVNYNDTDLCLRAIRAGYRVVYEPLAVLRHRECHTRRGGVGFAERERWYARWADDLDSGDPFYNPNLTRIGEDLALRSDESHEAVEAADWTTGA